MSSKDPKDGRIGRLNEQTLGYYRRVKDALGGGFDNETDEKDLFLRNVFETLTGEALSVSQNQTASTIVELLLVEADLHQLAVFGEALSKDWELVCTDRFASHVTQTLVCQLGARLSGTEDEAFQVFIQIYGFLMSNLAYYMQHVYTSHIVRVMLEALAGVRVSDNVIRSKIARQNKGNENKGAVTEVTEPDVRFKGLLKEMCDKITSLNMIKDYIKNPLSNPVLQTLVLVLHKRDHKKCRKISKSIIETTNMFELEAGADETSLPELVQHTTASHFVEQIIQVASEDLLETIITTQLSDKLAAMAVHSTANYVLQKLIKSCHSALQFETIFHEVRSHLESILYKNHNQVIVALAESCVKHGTKQEKFTKALMKCFRCHTPEERQTKCVQLFASLTTYDIFYKISSDDEQEEEMKFPELTKVNLHGSLLLQQLLHFGNPKSIVTSLLQLNPAELRNMSCDPCGNHVIETFITSNSIGEKSHDVLYTKLKGLYVDLACHKNGSRTLDALFNGASVKNRLTIIEELVQWEAKLRGDRFGRFCWMNYKVDHFQRNRNQWKQTQNSEIKKRKLFQEMACSDDTNIPKKKRKSDKMAEHSDKNESREDSGTQPETEEMAPSRLSKSEINTKHEKRKKHKKKHKH